MKREDIFFIVVPIVLAGAVIFGHYHFLVSQNPQVHSRPLVTTSFVQSLHDSELTPAAPTTSLPRQVSGEMQDIPTSIGKLTELLNRIRAQGGNVLLLKIGMKLTPDGSIILSQGAESSQELLLRWTKKTVSEAHKQGLHTYVALMFIEQSQVADPGKFSSQLKELIARWGNMAQEYHVSYFLPGIVLGQFNYNSLPQENLQVFVTEIERAARETYTGLLGIGLCCSSSAIAPSGYNQLLIITDIGAPDPVLIMKARADAKRYGIEYIFILDQNSQRLSSIE